MGSTLEEQNKEAPEPNRYYDASYKRHLVTYKREEYSSKTDRMPLGGGSINKAFRLYVKDPVDDFLANTGLFGEDTIESSRGRRAARLEVLKYEEGGSVTEDLKRNDGRIAKKTKVY